MSHQQVLFLLLFDVKHIAIKKCRFALTAEKKRFKTFLFEKTRQKKKVR